MVPVGAVECHQRDTSSNPLGIPPGIMLYDATPQVPRQHALGEKQAQDHGTAPARETVTTPCCYPSDMLQVIPEQHRVGQPRA